ncbi:MAG: hypothetical protein HQL38_03135 [Alphaproteobacteria bacterium]|nr:hypothetical protein [Alphaproteobacteria bacterium]
MTIITVEQIEALAAQIEQEDDAERARLHRLIRAYARIVEARDPEQFQPQALEYSDEDGHSDNSYPPKQKYKDHRGPRLFEVIDSTTTSIATSGGFYYQFRTVTEDEGLFVAPDGVLFGCVEEGTGRLGQFAAHPGDCGVMNELTWSSIAVADVPLDRLRKAEEALRKVAFPLATAASTPA